MSLVSLQKQLDATRQMGHLDTSFFDALNGYDKIVLRGAGRFGKEIGQHLLEQGVPARKMVFWDVRAQDLKSLHGIPVRPPFESDERLQDTLVIHCIPNGSLSGSTIRAELVQHGYQNILDGMALFEAGFCQMRSEEGYRSEVCLNTTVCNWDACDRLMHFVKRDCSNPRLTESDDRLAFQVMAFVLSLKCTLSCTHCGQYINTYEQQGKAQHIPLAQLKHDIDRFFDHIDTVGFVSVIGGESLLHPDFDKVIRHILTKPNFGVLGVTTNGVCKLTEVHLSALKNTRTRLIFSDYTTVLTGKQKALFEQNVQKAKDFGVNVTVGAPVWAEPPSLESMGFNESEMTQMKTNCNSHKTCQTIQNGRLYPCGIAPVVHELDAGHYDTDFISLDEQELREKLIALQSRPYYQSCDHCGDGGKHLTHSGEQQGYHSRYDHLLKGIEVVTR